MKSIHPILWISLLPVSLACKDGNPNKPPDGASEAQKQAFARVNEIRASAGLPDFEMLDTINAAAQSHAEYFANNQAAYGSGLSPHNEDPSFPDGFTGVNFFDRMPTAGFTGQAFFEVMAFSNNPDAAIDLWLNSVFHRVPLIHPNSTQMGYGGASGTNGAADVIDFGAGASTDPNQIIVFPPPDATDAVGSFNIFQEGPNPPAPPGGGSTTGPVISVAFDNTAGADITVHELRDSAGNLLTHTFVTPATPGVGPFLSGTFAFYADGPAASGETFSVHIEGNANGASFTKDWSFTVR
jgi:hypothetical protein